MTTTEQDDIDLDMAMRALAGDRIWLHCLQCYYDNYQVSSDYETNWRTGYCPNCHYAYYSYGILYTRIDNVLLSRYR